MISKGGKTKEEESISYLFVQQPNAMDEDHMLQSEITHVNMSEREKQYIILEDKRFTSTRKYKNANDRNTHGTTTKTRN